MGNIWFLRMDKNVLEDYQFCKHNPFIHSLHGSCEPQGKNSQYGERVLPKPPVDRRELSELIESRKRELIERGGLRLGEKPRCYLAIVYWLSEMKEGDFVLVKVAGETVFLCRITGYVSEEFFYEFGLFQRPVEILQQLSPSLVHEDLWRRTQGRKTIERNAKLHVKDQLRDHLCAMGYTEGGEMNGWSLSIKAYSGSDLRSQLNKISIFVPPRGLGRKTWHTERYQIVYLLKALNSEGEISFPFELTHRDRPDFKISMSEVVHIGVECTEAISKNDATKQVSINREKNGFPSGLRMVEHESVDGSIKEREDLENEIKREKKLAAMPIPGDKMESNWVIDMISAVFSKVNASKKPGFEKFEENWLLIYDNTRSCGVELDDAAENLHSIMERKNIYDEFTKIYIMVGDEVLEFLRSGVRSLR